MDSLTTAGSRFQEGVKASTTTGGVLSAFSSTLHLNGGLDNQADAVFSNSTINGDINNTGNITVIGNVTINGNVTGGGDFFGPGTTIFNGSFGPGNSPGEVLFEGNATLEETATLNIEIGGTTRGAEYDALTVQGDATLDGTVEVVLIDGFTPRKGDSFEVINAAQIAGVFTELDLPDLGQYLVWNTDELYTQGNLGVSAVPTPTATLAGVFALGGLVLKRRRRPWHH